jgi:ribosomal protein S18 acetylase RimI-like enzyme
VPQLRRGVPDDRAALDALVVAAYSHYVERIGRPPGPMAADNAEALAHALVWVLEEGDRLIAASISRIRPDHLLIENLAVAPDVQGRGLGRLLLDRAERDAVDHGLHEVRLYTNEAMTENQIFYPRMGFTETGRGEQDGFRRVFYTKAL